jgi:hypothetical protein
MLGMTPDQRKHYASYTAPKLHGQKLLEPSLAELERLFGSKNSFASPLDNTVQAAELPLASLRHTARSKLVEAAVNYTSSYRDLPDIQLDSNKMIALSGHQPDLFHCGVWTKNFLLSQLGQSLGMIPIHFIVDNDLCRTVGIQVPRFESGQLSSRVVEFDKSSDPQPWENRQLQDRSIWESFPARVKEASARLRGECLLDSLWQHALRLDPTRPLGQLLSQARHLLEQDLGLRTLEVPLSQMVSTDEFVQFSWNLLNQLTSFQQVYNAELDRYRVAHRIRNHAQPLPNLAVDGEWQEAPFWVYHRTSFDRLPLWINCRDQRMTLSNRQGWEQMIPADASSYQVQQQWAELQAQGWRIRPRALVTTLYSRLILSDLFVHGIGGGKYDQITDGIIESFFGLQPPTYVVATATMRLSFDDLPEHLRPVESKPQMTLAEFKAIQANPEILLERDIAVLNDQQRVELKLLAESKRQLLASMPSKGEKWEWHIAMKKIKSQLGLFAAPYIAVLQKQLDQQQPILAQKAILNSREFSFCLFSREEIKRQFLPLND